MSETRNGDFKNVLSDRLRECFGNETLESVGRQFGVKTSSVSQWLSKDTAPKLETLIAISKRFNVSLDYLVGNTDCKSIDQEKQTACKVTGLTENATDQMVRIKKVPQKEITPLSGPEITQLEAMNMFIEKFGFDFSYILSQLVRCSLEYSALQRDCELASDEEEKQMLDIWLHDSNITMKSAENDLMDFMFELKKYFKFKSEK